MEITHFTKFRKHAAHYFDVVEKGEAISIMRHGKLIAKIIPIEVGQEKRVLSWKKPALKLSIKGVKLGKAILADRTSHKT